MKYLGLVLGLLLLVGCSAVPPMTQQATQRIPTGPGPEDFVLDTLSGGPRLLVSSMERRTATDTSRGDIWYFDLETRQSGIFPRIEEPKDLMFQPHGICLQRVDGKLKLWVISHDPDPLKNYVHLYQVTPDALVYLRTYTDPLFRSPNDLYALEDGSFFVSNDAFNRDSKGELLFGKKKSQIIYVTPEGKAEVVVDKVGMGNGVYQEGEAFFLTATRANRVYRFPVGDSLPWTANREIKLTGGDNITPSEKGLLTTGHVKPIAFLRHLKKSSRPSPTVVYQLDFEQEKAIPIFSDKGRRISAGSTALIWKNKLYIAQVFDPFLLEVELAE